jgi:hypothetical protein
MSNLEGYLADLRSMQPGVTWRDLFPDIPAHWEAGRPETWTSPYRPLGPFDHQELPTSFAVHIYWTPEGAPERLDELMREARRAGWPVYGAGIIPMLPGRVNDTHAHVVLERGATEEQYFGLCDWLEQQPNVTIAVYSRNNREKYLE